MTRDELIALLLVGGFRQDERWDEYPRRAHVYSTDTIAVSLVPDEEWGVWDASASVNVHAYAYAHVHVHAVALAHTRDHARAIGTPDEYTKCWQTIKELIDD